MTKDFRIFVQCLRATNFHFVWFHVFRFGLPPPGIVPPQDWLPNALHHKSPENLFAYTSVFMRHLYDDPNAMDESTDWLVLPIARVICLNGCCWCV